MGIINKGNQSITFDFKHPLKGSAFNTLLRNILTPGIYEGGELTNIENEVYISPFSALINTDDDKTIKITTTSPVNITVVDSTPYIKMSFTWQDAIENWADFETSSTYTENDVIFGKALFTSGVCVGFDLTERTYGKRPNIEVDSYSPPLIVNSQVKVNNLNADLLDGHHSVDIIPIGGIIMYAGTPTTDPAPTLTNFLYCDGSAVSRTIYSNLFNVIGTTWGAGDGVSTFNIPNGKGLIARGLGDYSFSDRVKSGGSLGQYIEDTFQGHEHSLRLFESGTSGTGYLDNAASTYDSTYKTWEIVTNSINGTPRISDETKPSTFSIRFYIRYK